MAKAPSATDPRLRPFRAATIGLYLVLVIGFCLAVIVSVVRSVVSMSPSHLPASEVTWSTAECADKASSLFDALEAQRRGFADYTPVRDVDQSWTTFRLSWLTRLREAESHCALEGQSREALADVYGRLERLMNLYTTHAVQYAGEIGGSVDRFREAAAAARR